MPPTNATSGSATTAPPAPGYASTPVSTRPVFAFRRLGGGHARERLAVGGERSADRVCRERVAGQRRRCAAIEEEVEAIRGRVGVVRDRRRFGVGRVPGAGGRRRAQRRCLVERPGREIGAGRVTDHHRPGGVEHRAVRGLVVEMPLRDRPSAGPDRLIAGIHRIGECPASDDARVRLTPIEGAGRALRQAGHRVGGIGRNLLRVRNDGGPVVSAGDQKNEPQRVPQCERFVPRGMSPCHGRYCPPGCPL